MALLDELRAALTRYVVFPSPETADAVALWTAATHGQDAWEHAPRCAVVSPEKRCGKSRLLDIAEATCHQSLVTVNISSAALVRTVTAEDPPTLFIDEADTVFGPKAADNHEDLRGIVNAGHQRGRPYIRYDIITRRNEHLATFCIAMLAGIGNLPDTIMDRSIVVRMRRRAPGERVDPYRTRRDRPALHVLRDRLGAWVKAHIKELTHVEPDMPVEDRAADTWEPLVAIADLAGGDWPARARKAARVLVAAEGEEDAAASLGMRLLADIRDLYRDFTVAFMPSGELVNRLRKLDEAPWNERDLNTTALAALLRPYGVKPGHNSAKTARGYDKDWFADAFARYLASEPVRVSAQGADQQERPDGFPAPDGSTRPDTTPDGWTGSDGYPGESLDEPNARTGIPVRATPTRPDESAGQDGSTDTRTGSDAQVRGTETCPDCGEPYESLGHEINCEELEAPRP